MVTTQREMRKRKRICIHITHKEEGKKRKKEGGRGFVSSEKQRDEEIKLYLTKEPDKKVCEK